MTFTVINNLEDLGLLNKELLERPFVGLDTEFRRTTKENLKLSLIQVNDSEEIYLIDCLEIGHPGDNCSFLCSAEVKKIFHSCKEDLESIYSWNEKAVLNIFDTQLANSFLNGTFSISYQSLVEEKMGVTLNKRERRTNWLRRPLSESQLKYAAADVEFLIEIFEVQKKSLLKKNKLDWLDEEISFLYQDRLKSETSFSEDIFKGISKAQEKILLKRFNKIVLKIAAKKEINCTLLSSKKNQRDLLKIILSQGIENALNTLPLWRRSLLEAPLIEILRESTSL